ncbi:GNAT family N-acetyltransferase [Spirillospora sp. CA-294931]|uniref:GNAT family N-acetyltransferase n=1 Tax=Spirillospora sp. CA-294931 TaxID=3240042 RepID=UPI003D8F7424
MGYQRRPYTGPDDLRRMQALAERVRTDDSRWHAGELAWMRYQHLGREPEWRTSLWQDGDVVVGWAWARAAGELDLQIDPAHPRLAGEILRWFDRVAGGACREISVGERDKALVEALRAHGYREQRSGPFFVHLARGLDDLPEPVVPDGYVLRPVRGEEDADARAAVHRAAFSLPGLPPSRVNGQSYRRVMDAWPYRTDLDWLVEAPDGTPVSFCLLWLDAANRDVQLEPVGTAPGHRRRGLASAAILGALHAARDLGAETARVCARGDDAHPSARATYQSLGFERFARNLTFVK